MTNVLVTGATGFIGPHLVKRLVARGDSVTCLVHGKPPANGLRALGVHCVPGDIRDLESLRIAVAGNRVIYHLAGMVHAFDIRALYDVNRDGTANVAQACAELSSPPTLVVVSSLAAAGPGPQHRPRTEADVDRPISHYGRSKLAGEHAATRWAAHVPITVVRPSIVIGEGDLMLLPAVQSIARFGIHWMPGLARPRYSLIHAGDLCRLLILAAEAGSRVPPNSHGRNGQSSRLSGHPHHLNGHGGRPGYYYAAAEETIGYAEMGRIFGQALGRRHVAVVPLATPLVWLAGAGAQAVARLRGAPMGFDVDKACEATAGSWICSSQTAREQLGFTCGASLEERLHQAAAWYRREGLV